MVGQVPAELFLSPAITVLLWELVPTRWRLAGRCRVTRADYQIMAETTEIIIATTLRGRRDANGVQTQFFTFRDYLAATGIPVRIVSALSYHSAIVYPVLAIRRLIAPFSARLALRWHRWSRFLLIRSALRQVCADGADLVIYAQDALTAEAALQVRKENQSVVLAMHNTRSEADEWVDHDVIEPTSSMYAAIRSQERAVLPRVDKLVFTSEPQRSDIASIFPEIALVPCAVVPEFIAQPETSGAAPVHDAITVGALERRKNHRFIIDVIATAKAMGHEFTLTIVGEGPERDALATHIRERGIEGLVTLTGRVNHDIGLELEKHRIYLHASVRESFGLAVVEALATGLPTVIGNTGVAELLDNGVDTWIWPDINDPQSGAELLVSIMTDPEKMRAVGALGRQRYEQSFSVSEAAPRLAACLLDETIPIQPNS
jgi:glycosyltransferase involved in cell wall biosynthesis